MARLAVEVEIDSRLSGWYFGNIALSVFGVVGALVVDPLTGAMWTLDVDELSVTLPSSPPLLPTRRQ